MSENKKKPMSMWQYTCIESALMISPFSALASSMDKAVFPTAVGPVRMISGCFIASPLVRQFV